jgi:hypothetical protein
MEDGASRDGPAADSRGPRSGRFPRPEVGPIHAGTGTGRWVGEIDEASSNGNGRRRPGK